MSNYKQDIDKFKRGLEVKLADAVMQAASETIIQNAKRDKMCKGIERIAGAKGCTYCAEHAGVYTLDEVGAGKMGGRHEGCRCNFLPVFGDVEKRKRDAKLKAAQIAAEAKLKAREAEKWMEIAKRCKVNQGRINTKQYLGKVFDLFGEKIAIDVYLDIRHTLKTKGGTPYENLYAYDLTINKRIGRIEDTNTPFEVRHTDKYDSAVKKAKSAGHKVATVHNHPQSSLPSAQDIRSLHALGVDFGVIVCHDGSILRYSVSDKWLLRENLKDIGLLKLKLERLLVPMLNGRKAEKEALATIKKEVGVQIERYEISGK